MKHYEGAFAGVRGIDIRYQYWLPEDAPHASLLIVHGLAEHCGRYINLINHFIPLGYAVFGVDHIGHGKSGGRRAHVKRFSDFISILSTYVEKIRGWQPEAPLFMIGHSLGALIGAIYLLDHPSDVVGAIFSGPLVSVPENISPATVLLSRLLSVVVPKLGVATVDPTGVSRDKAVVRAYVADPLVYNGKTTARLGCETLKAMRRVARQGSEIELPLLVLQGGADRLVSPRGAEMLYSVAGSTDKTLKVYEGLYHEIYNEPERHQILADAEAWLRERLPTSDSVPSLD